MQGGICSIIWKDRLDLFQIIETAKRTGAQGIEVWGQAPHVPEPTDLGHVAAIRAALCAAGLAAPQYGSYARAGMPGFAAKLRADLAVASGLGAPACRVWAGPANAEELSQEQWSSVVGDLSAACRLAAEQGILLTMERHGGTATNSLWGCVRVFQEVAEPALRINYQVGDTDTARIAEEIRVLGPVVLNVHAMNWRQVGPQRECTRLSDGAIDWRALVHALREAGNDGFIEIEFVRRGAGELSLGETERELAVDVAYLKECISS